MTARLLPLALAVVLIGCDRGSQVTDLHSLRGAPDGSTAEGGRVKKIGTGEYELTVLATDQPADLEALAGGACAGQEMCSVTGALNGRRVFDLRKRAPVGSVSLFDCAAYPTEKARCL